MTTIILAEANKMNNTTDLFIVVKACVEPGILFGLVNGAEWCTVVLPILHTVTYGKILSQYCG